MTKSKHPHPIMTAHPITLITLGLFMAWSLCSCFRLLTHESEIQEMKRKVHCIQTVRKVHTAFTLGAVACIFLMPALWQVLVTIIVYTVALNWKITRKQNRLHDEIDAYHQSESILSLKLGTMDYTANGSPLKIWFKRSRESWPVAELEIGVDISTLPIDKTPEPILRDYILPRLVAALQGEATHDVFYRMKMDLVEHGVSHPINIKGWDHHPVIREMIEQIMNSAPMPHVHCDESANKAA